MADSYVNTQAPLRTGELSQPIQINTNNLSSMIAKGAAYVEMEAEKCPIKIDRLFGVKTGSAAMLETPGTQTVIPPRHKAFKVDDIFARGQLVYDEENAMKATIIKANVGQTRKGRPIHRLANSRGDTWLQSQRKLRKL